jgi:hypothetical protein
MMCVEKLLRFVTWLRKLQIATNGCSFIHVDLIIFMISHLYVFIEKRMMYQYFDQSMYLTSDLCMYPCIMLINGTGIMRSVA